MGEKGGGRRGFGDTEHTLLPAPSSLSLYLCTSECKCCSCAVCAVCAVM